MKDVIELAKEAGFTELDLAQGRMDILKDFAALVRAEREWVDLTDDEIHEALHGKDAPVGLLNGIRNVIADFKEKNK